MNRVLRCAPWLVPLAFVALMIFPSFAYADVDLDEAHFPDQTFRNYLYTAYDLNQDHVLSDAEIAAILNLDLDDLQIESLVGIEYLTATQRIYLNGNNVSGELDLSSLTNLRYARLDGNPFTALNTTGLSRLQYLMIDNTEIAELDLTTNTRLVSLTVREGNLTYLDVSANAQLATLICTRNQLSELDVSNNTRLRDLHCEGNGLTELDLSNASVMTDLNCSDNDLSSLQLGTSSDYERIICSGNRIALLELPNADGLFELNCADNELTSLDLAGNEFFEFLDYSGNHLLDVAVPVPSDQLMTHQFDRQTRTVAMDWLGNGRYGSIDPYPMTAPTFGEAVVYDAASQTFIMEDGFVDSSSFLSDTGYLSAGAMTHTQGTIQFLVESYTVSFVDWDGTPLGASTVIKGTSAAAPADPTRDGYTFTGWDTDYSEVVGNMVVTAQYEAIPGPPPGPDPDPDPEPTPDPKTDPAPASHTQPSPKVGRLQSMGDSAALLVGGSCMLAATVCASTLLARKRASSK